MQMREFGAQIGERHFAWNDLVAKRATKFVEPLCLGLLISRPLSGGHLCDQIHRGQHPDTAFKPAGQPLSFFRKTQLAIFTCHMTGLATVIVEYILGEFFPALVRRDHFVQRDTGD